MAGEQHREKDGARRYLVLTDMHFGTPESAVNDQDKRAALAAYLADGSPWDEIVLAGDILDMNLSSLTLALEGGGALCGFRKFLGELHARMQAKKAGGSLADVAGRWVYVPGNHDYKLWDMLATQVVCEDVLAAGDPMGTVKTPLQRHAWSGKSSFLSGIFKAKEQYDLSGSVDVEYPDHSISFDEEVMLVTHGHYLDASQTRFTDISEILPDGLPPEEVASRIRRLFIETAQYQAVASAVSYTRDTKRIVSDLFGPAGLANKIGKLVDAARGLAATLFFGGGGSRGEGLSGKWLRNIDSYLQHMAPKQPAPRAVRWFVFGHTHKQGTATTPKGVAVYNAGSCYADGQRPATFIEVVGSRPVQVLLRGLERVQQKWTVV